jgi:hypothetical protein
MIREILTPVHLMQLTTSLVGMFAVAGHYYHRVLVWAYRVAERRERKVI